MTRISSGADEIGRPGTIGATTLMITRYRRLQTRYTLNARTGCSDQHDLLELRLDNLFVERFHDVLVGAGVKRPRDVRHIVLGGAEHHLWPVAARETAERLEELVAVHLRHVPIEQDGVRKLHPAGAQRLLAVLGLGDLEFHALPDAAGGLSDGA